MKMFPKLNKGTSLIKTIYKPSFKKPWLFLIIGGAVAIIILIKFPPYPSSVKTPIYKIYLIKADEFYQQGDLMKARDAYLDFIERFPSSPELNRAYYQLANTFKEMGLRERAIFFYEKINNQKLSYYCESRYQLAECYYQIGQIKKATQIAKKAIKNFPESKRIYNFYLILANSLLNDGKKDKAAAFYYKIIKNSADDSLLQKTYFKLADLCFKEKKYSEAIIYYSKLVNEYPGDELQQEALFYLIRCYLARDQIEQALSILSTFTGKYSSNTFFSRALLACGESLLNKKEYKRALEVFKEAEKYSPEDPYIRLETKKEVARVYLLQKNYPEAAKLYEEILRDYPYSKDEEKIYFNLGELYLKMGEYHKAADIFKMFVHSFPLSSLVFSAYFNLGESYIGEGYLFKAADTFDYILKNSSSKDDVKKALLKISDIYMRTGLWKKATIFLKKALYYVDEKTGFQIKVNLAKSYIAQRNFSSAEKITSEIFKNIPDDHSSIWQIIDLADMFYSLGKRELAFDIYQKAGKLKSLNKKDKRWLFVLFKMGNLQKSKGKINLTIKIYQQILGLSKKYSDPEVSKLREKVLLLLADIYYRSKKNYKRALPLYLKALEEYPESEDTAWCIYQIGNCYRKKGLLKLAEKYYKKLEDKFPDTLWTKISGVIL